MRKIAVVLVLAAVATIVALRLVRGDNEPAIAGTWRELRPPNFE